MPQDTLLRFLLQLWLLLASLYAGMGAVGAFGRNCWSDGALCALLASLPWCFSETLALPLSLLLLLLSQVILSFLHKIHPLSAACGALFSGCVWTFFLLLLPVMHIVWVLALSALLCALACCLLYKELHRVKPRLEPPDLQQKGILAIWVCMVGVLLLFLLWNGWLLRHESDLLPSYAQVFALATALVFCLCMSLLYALLQATQFRVETLLDRQFQQELESFMQVIRSQRHDFNFHVQALSGMLEAGRYDECHAYMQSLVKSVNHLNQVLPFHHPAVSAMFNAFQEMAFRSDIPMEIRIENDLSRLPCTVLEINTIMGNLLQNAIDETVQLPKSQRWIHVLVVKRGAKNVIKVSNPHHLTEEDFRHVFEAGHSTKKGHQGIGLTTVKRLVTRCHGTIHTEFGEGFVHFIVQLPIPLEI